MNSVYIQDYTEKSFVVRGDTQPHKETIKSMGGKWGSRFTDKDTGDRFGAWIFPKSKKSTLQSWIDNDCPEKATSVSSTGSSKSRKYTTSTSSTKNVDNSAVQALQKQVSDLSKELSDVRHLLERLCEAQGVNPISPRAMASEVPVTTGKTKTTTPPRRSTPRGSTPGRKLNKKSSSKSVQETNRKSKLKTTPASDTQESSSSESDSDENSSSSDVEIEVTDDEPTEPPKRLLRRRK